ncbi:MAG: PH domain-containing protein [Candidatus Micrarchaeota archaeon]
MGTLLGGGEKGPENHELPKRFFPKYWAIFVHKYWLVLLLIPVFLVWSVLEFFGIISFGLGHALIALGASLALTAGCMVHTKLHKDFMYYELTNNAIVMKRGIINRNTLSVPIEMITDLAIHRNVEEHLLETAVIMVNTAGTGIGYTIKMRYLRVEEARWVHAKLLEMKKEHPGPPGKPVQNMPWAAFE